MVIACKRSANIARTIRGRAAAHGSELGAGDVDHVEGLLGRKGSQRQGGQEDLRDQRDVVADGRDIASLVVPAARGSSKGWGMGGWHCSCIEHYLSGVRPA